MRLLETQIPTETYLRLRAVSGLSAKTDEAATIGLANSVYSVMVEADSEIIGMGRIIGDGGCFCQIVDICVSPEHQGKGVGKAIMRQLVNFIHSHLPRSCYVSLIADGDAKRLYAQFGFVETLPGGAGMFLKV